MKNLLIALFLIMLTGCATTAPQSVNTTPWPQRQMQLATLKHWVAEGSIGARSASQGLNASFAWQQQADDYSIQLFGPLGIHRTELTGNKQQVTLQTNSHIYTAHNPELLLQQQTGWRLPVSNLYYWLRGLPAPHLHHSKTLDSQHHIAELKQAGWNIQYLNYIPMADMDLPERILLTNPQWQVRLVIHNWQL